ncbi:MAG: 3-dehydro-scyllo-inosose hydrolase [Candidatus Helarchaeota archaeon]
MSKWNYPQKGKIESAEPKLYLQNMSIKEVEDRLKKNDLIIVVVGSVENHGPSCPLGQDTYQCTRMAEIIAEKTGCTIAPPVWYGSHPFHHVGMPGTIVIPEDIFIGQLRAIMAGLWNMGFRKQIYFNNHGQEYVIPSAIHQFAKRYQVPCIILNYNWYHGISELLSGKDVGNLESGFDTTFVHADEVETSFAMALFPEFVDKSKLTDTQPRGFLDSKFFDKAGNCLHRPIAWYGVVGAGPAEFAAYPEGCVGCQTKASPEKAKKAIDKILDTFEELINMILEKYPPGKLPDWKQLTQRFTDEEMELLLKGPLKGGKHIYTVFYPP